MKAKARPVVAYGEGGFLAGEFASVSEASRKTLVDAASIKRCCGCRMYGELCARCTHFRRWGLVFRDA